MKNIVVGTAGHIDHGKTSLVRVLTGIDTDRLDEEKRRGISIDLGFAHLDLTQETRIAFVDVPGHEKFIKNMLAGVGGIDLVLFVIAGDESIKPQTREHFDICRLLNIKRGLIALTKSDLIETDIQELVRMEVDEFVAGSFLEGAPIVPVSAATGAGLDDLKKALLQLAASVQPKDQSSYLRLPIDRAFLMKGFGTVVTGTLIAGSVSVDQEVELHPGPGRLRVRGVQVHGKSAKTARAGQRTALNLVGAEHPEIRRGMVLVQPEKFRDTQLVDSSFELLPGAKPLKHAAPVHFHAGTAEVEASVRLLEGTSMKPGTHAYVRFLLREPALLLPGDRFIVRMFSPVVTIGGGVVLDIAAPRKLARAAALARLKTLAEGTPLDRISILLSESECGMGVSNMVARTGMTTAAIEAAIDPERILYVREPQAWLLDGRWVKDALLRIHKEVVEFHRKYPLLPGMLKEELRSRYFSAAPAFLLDLLLQRERLIVVSGDVVRLASHKLSLKQDEEGAVAKIEAAFEKAGLAVPSTPEVLASSGVEAARARSLLQILLRDKKLVRVGEDLVFHHTALEKLRALLAERKGTRFAVPEFKEWTGISRKYAIPLLEFLDRERVTRREGDSRVVL